MARKLPKQSSPTKKGGKKRKSDEAADKESDMQPKKQEQELAKTVAESSIPIIDKKCPIKKSLFKLFNDMLTDNEDLMQISISKVIQFLSQIKDEDEQKKHLDYVLKRCIRACGSTRLIAVNANGACLTTLLQVFDTMIPLQQVFQILEKELVDGGSREDIQGISGQIMVCSSIVRGGRLVNDETDIKQFTDILINTIHRRAYQARMAYTTFRNAFEVVSPEAFKNVMWTPLKKELLKPWPKQTINTIETLIAINKIFPDVMKADIINDYWNGSELLSQNSYEDLYRIFVKETCGQNALPEAIDTFAIYISNNCNLVEFWEKVVDPDLQNATKLQQKFILRVLKTIFENQSKPKNWSKFLTKNFMKMYLDGLKQQKKSKHQEAIKYFVDFTHTLIKVCEKLDSDEEKLELIYHLIKPPTGILCIGKYTDTNIVHQMIHLLGKDGVISIYDFYHNIFTGQLSIANDNKNNDDGQVLFDRKDAGFMLQYLLSCKSIQDSVEWRCQKLCSLFKYGIFHVNEQLEICKADEASDFSNTYYQQSEHVFFNSFKVNKNTLKTDKDLMDRLIDNIDLLLMKRKNHDKLKAANICDETAKTAWTEMKTFLDSLVNNEKVPKALIILLQYLGIQLFSEPSTKLSTIKDVCQCITLQQNENDNSSDDVSEKLHWTHVLVDIALHLLSLNKKSLRNLVVMVFNNMSDCFDINVLHYILSLLNMKDGLNPLSNQNDEDSDDESDDGDGSDNELDNDNENQKSDDDSENEDSEDDDDDDESEDEDSDDDADETITEFQVLRNDLSQALMANGAAPMADDDADSIDLNDITEEQGRKLDEAIAGVFRARGISEKRPNNHKKSKNYRTMTTTTMHFRSRVLDLVQIIREQHSRSFSIATTIMQSLYEMLQYCTTDDLKTLKQKTDKILNQVISKTNYNNNKDDEKVQGNQMEICSIIRQFVRTPILIKDQKFANRLLSQCFMFLILNGSRLPEKKNEENILALCLQYIQEYINKRSATLNVIVFTELFNSRWSGIWQLGKTLAADGILNQTRIYRRIQAYKLIMLLYSNKSNLSELSNDIVKSNLLDIETPIYDHIQKLANSDKVKTTGREVDGLFELILKIERAYTKYNFQLYGASTLCNKTTPSLMEMVRKRVSLNEMKNYKNYCCIHKLKVLYNNDIPNLQKDDCDEEEEMEGPCDKDAKADANQVPNTVEKKKALKRKADINNENVDDNNIIAGDTKKVSAKKQKKIKKEERLKAASRGLNGGFFQQQDADDIEDTSTNDIEGIDKDI